MVKKSGQVFFFEAVETRRFVDLTMTTTTYGVLCLRESPLKRGREAAATNDDDREDTSVVGCVANDERWTARATVEKNVEGEAFRVRERYE